MKNSNQPKGKYLRKERPHGIQPYVPPRLQRPTVSLEPQQKSKPIIASRQSKTVDIFEGMTLSELSKRAGQPISTLQNTLASVGEPVGSEFDPLSSDVLEIVAMVIPSSYALIVIPTKG